MSKPLEELFPYQICKACSQAFYVNRDLNARCLTEDEKEAKAVALVHAVEDLKRKKLANSFHVRINASSAFGFVLSRIFLSIALSIISHD